MITARSSHLKDSGTTLSTSFRSGHPPVPRPATVDTHQLAFQKKKKRKTFSPSNATRGTSLSNTDVEELSMLDIPYELSKESELQHFLSLNDDQDDAHLQSEYAKMRPIMHEHSMLQSTSKPNHNKGASSANVSRDSIYHQISNPTGHKPKNATVKSISPHTPPSLLSKSQTPSDSSQYQTPRGNREKFHGRTDKIDNLGTNSYIKRYNMGVRRSKKWNDLTRLGLDSNGENKSIRYHEPNHSNYDELPEIHFEQAYDKCLDTFTPKQGTKVLLNHDNALHIMRNAADLYSRNMREGWYIDQGHWIDNPSVKTGETQSLPRNLNHDFGTSVPLVHTVLTEENVSTCQNVVCTTLRKKYYLHINADIIETGVKKCEEEIFRWNSDTQIVFRDSFTTNPNLTSMKYALEKKIISAMLLVICENRGHVYMPQYIPASPQMFKNNTTLSEEGKLYSFTLLQENLFHMPVEPFCHMKKTTSSPFAYYLNQPKFQEQLTRFNVPRVESDNRFEVVNFAKEETDFIQVPLHKITRLLIGGTGLNLLVDREKYYLQKGLGTHVICVPLLTLENTPRIIYDFFAVLPVKYRKNIKQIIIQLSDQMPFDMRHAYESVMMCKNYHFP